MSDNEQLKEAFAAGYKARELDVREDDRITDRIIDRKFKTFMRGRE